MDAIRDSCRTYINDDLHRDLGKVLAETLGFPFVLTGMDSIDASDLNTDFLGHTVFAKTRTVLSNGLEVCALDAKWKIGLFANPSNLLLDRLASPCYSTISHA